MKIQNFISLLLLTIFQIGCSVGYILKSGYEQQKILMAREPIVDVLKNKNLEETKRKKLELILKVRKFATEQLRLKESQNYTSYVELNRPYVSWIVTASDKFQVSPYKWWFPIVGHVPYKGYFSQKEAIRESKNFNSKYYDTYVRGVSAYSTLGWFSDPVLSTMMNYEDTELIELIIHESVHATIYIKNHAEFNERLATFLGQVGTQKYYEIFYPNDKMAMDLLAHSSHDQMIFSKFISSELNDLKKWYEIKAQEIFESSDDKKFLTQVKENKWSSKDLFKNLDKSKIKELMISKNKKLKEIQNKFQIEIQPLLKTSYYSNFSKIELNNAILTGYETYMRDLKDFEFVFEKTKKDFGKFLDFCKSLEKSQDPESDLQLFGRS